MIVRCTVNEKVQTPTWTEYCAPFVDLSTQVSMYYYDYCFSNP